MDRIEKFLKKLTKKMAINTREALKDILKLSLEGYDTEKMKGYKSLYRLRIGKIRIIYINHGDHGEIPDIEFRANVYKNLK